MKKSDRDLILRLLRDGSERAALDYYKLFNRCGILGATRGIERLKSVYIKDQAPADRGRDAI